MPVGLMNRRRAARARSAAACRQPAAGPGAHQQVLKDLQVAVVVRQVCRAVQRREAAVVALVHLRAAVEQVV